MKHKCSLRDGTPFVRGPGGPTGDKVEAKLSDGEAVLPTDTVQAVGPENIQALIDATHTPVKSKGLRSYANGVDEFDPRYPDGQPGPSVSTQLPVESPVSSTWAAPSQPAAQHATSSSQTSSVPIAAPPPVADPRYPGGQQGPSVSTQLPAEPGPAPWYKQPHARVVAPPPAGPGVTRGPSIPDVSMDGLRASTDNFLPNARMVSRIAGGDANAAINRGAYGAAAGHLLRGTAAAIPAFLDDAFLGPGRALSAQFPRVAGATTDKNVSQFVGDAVRTAVTGQDPVVKPAGAGTPPPLDNKVLPGTQDLPDMPNPRDMRLASGMEVPTGESASTVRFGNQQGKTVPGMENSDVRKFKTGDGRTIYSNVAGDNDFMMKRAGPITEQNSNAATALSDKYGAEARASLRGGLDEQNLPAGYGATIPAYGADYDKLDLRDPGNLAARNAGVKSVFEERDMPPSLRQKRDQANADRGERRAIAGMQDATQRRGQDVHADTSREGHRVSMRGQDLSYGSTTRGQDMSARSAAAQARQQQANSDRTYELDKAKYGTEVAEKNRAAAAASDDALRKDMETRFRTQDANGNSVVDHDKVAAFSSSMNATLPRMAEALEATGKPEAIAKAKAIRERGTAALEKGDIDGLQQLFDRRERVRQSKGWGPNTATYKDSDNLMDYRQTGVEQRTFGGNRVVMPGGSVSVNDLRYTEPANRYLPDWFKTESNRYSRGIRGE
jgi:hypothetical protein